MGFIYKITNDINSKVYVGKTLHSTIEERFKEHQLDSLKRTYEKRPLYSAMRKYGIEHFKIELIGEYPDNLLNEMEIYWIAYYHGYDEGYNATKGGDGRQLYDHAAIVDRLQECPYCLQVANEFNCGIDLIYELAKKNNIYIKSTQEQNKERFSKSVIKLDKISLEEIEEFSSLTEAAQDYLISNGKVCNKSTIKGVLTHIRECANGSRKSAYGYCWKFKKDISDKKI